jgi:glycosyltransferase involved in cell wall biosynthesis
MGSGLKKKILIVENSVHITGALKSVCRTAYDLRDFFDFAFVVPTGSKGRSWIEGKGFTKIYELPLLEISKRPKSLLLYLPMLLKNSNSLAKIARRERIDLVHVNDLYNLVLPSARLFGLTAPYICHVRFLPEKFPATLFNFWIDTHLRFSKRIVAVSQYLEKQLPTDSAITVIYNELPVEERYPLGLPKLPNPTILYLSNVIKGKGHQFAIETFARIHESFPDWRLRFVGGDMGLAKNAQYRSDLKVLCEQRGIASKTEWIEFTEDVEREYRQAELVLNFSESESFSITCLEALFFGCPIVATDSGGPAEIIDNNVTGFLVPKGDLNAMEKCVRSLMSDEGQRKRFASEGMRVVRTRFSVENTSYRLKSVYEESMSGPT